MHPSSDIRWGVIGCGQIAVDKSIQGLLATIADPLEPHVTEAHVLEFYRTEIPYLRKLISG